MATDDYMIEHFKEIENAWGNDAYINMPNSIFKYLSSEFKKRSEYNENNSIAVSFSYAYLVTSAFLYKYASYVTSNRFIKTEDIKQILGYRRDNKTLNDIIKKNGLLDELGLTSSTTDYPVTSSVNKVYNGINIEYEYEFKTIKEYKKESEYDEVSLMIYNECKDIVSNNRYTIKIPEFLFEYDGLEGTLQNFENTHRITLHEFINLIYDRDYGNIGFYFYGYMKSICSKNNGYKYSTSVSYIQETTGLSRYTFYKYLKKSENNNYIHVDHGKFIVDNSDEFGRANIYTFLGV